MCKLYLLTKTFKFKFDTFYIYFFKDLIFTNLSVCLMISFYISLKINKSRLTIKLILFYYNTFLFKFNVKDYFNIIVILNIKKIYTM